VAAGLGGLAVDELVAEVAGAGAHHVDGLREACLVDEEHGDFDFDMRRAMVIASAAAVASSSSEALASSRPVRSITICW
jgi:hypothetical protein